MNDYYFLKSSHAEPKVLESIGPFSFKRIKPVYKVKWGNN